MKRYRMLAIPILICMTAATSAFAGDGKWEPVQPDFTKPATFVHEWNRLLIEIIKVDGFTPGSAARNYAYANVAAYQAALPGFPDCKSLAGQLNGLTPTPLSEPGKEYDWRVAVVSAYEHIAPSLIYRSNMSDSAAAVHYDLLKQMGVPADVMERSQKYGEIVADHVKKWMKGDHFVEIGARPRFEVPKFPGAWERTPPAFHDPVDAYWYMHRTFAIDSVQEFYPPPPPEFSTDPESEFYGMVKDVYDAYNNLTKEQELIATFWDCNPIHSHFDGHFMFNTRQVSPGGHWISITAIACEKAGTDMMKSLEIYTRVSCALADGFITAFAAKYHWNLIRPVTYIKRHIDENWEPLIETPPFPEWPSAHSTISAAAGAVLTEMLGADFEFDDWTEAYLGLPVRKFSSFREAALEVTWSRVWGGIHYIPSCMSGTEKGWELGTHVARHISTRKGS